MTEHVLLTDLATLVRYIILGIQIFAQIGSRVFRAQKYQSQGIHTFCCCIKTDVPMKYAIKTPVNEPVQIHSFTMAPPRAHSTVQ